MRSTRRRVLGAGLAAATLAALTAGTPAIAGGHDDHGHGRGHEHEPRPRPRLQPEHPAALVQRLPRPPRGHRRAAVRDPRPVADGGRRRGAPRHGARRPAQGGTEAPLAHRRRRRPHRRLPVPLRALPRRAVGRVAQRDEARREQRRQPRVRRGHRRAPPDAEGRVPPGRRLLLPEAPVPRRRLPVARGQRRQEVQRPHPPAGHLGREGRRHEGRLHRDDPRGHPDPRRPGRGRERRLQGRGRDGQPAGRAAAPAGREVDRRPAPRGRLPVGHLRRLRRHLRPDQDDRRDG